MTTDAPSGIRRWITKTAITRALTGDPGREVDTRVKAQKAKATAEVAGAKEAEKANKQGNDTNATTRRRPEEAGGATRIGGGDSWR